MREHEARRWRSRWHPWFKRISHAAAHLTAATLLAASAASDLAARKQKSRQDHRGGRDQAERDADGGKDRDRGDKQGNDSKEDRDARREQRDRSHGDADGGNHKRNGNHERQGDESRDDRSASSEQTSTPTPTPTPTPEPDRNDGGGNDGGGNGGRGDGGRGDGGGNDAGNAGSGFFDSPLATKARRRAKDFENRDRDDEDDRTVADVDPDGESVYETDSVSLTTGPDGLEIVTGNITYFAEPTPTPEPLPTLELPVREPGFPFGEDFPFGNTAVVSAPATEPPDPGDTDTAPVSRAEPIPTTGLPEPTSSDGGDNTMDFSS